MNYFILLPILFIALAVALFLWSIRAFNRNEFESPESTRKFEVNDTQGDIDVPEEDQQYLAPLLAKVVKHLAANKMSYPTNAMLIDHLVETAGQAADSFKRRTNKDKTIERGNDLWLDVASLAIRLYDEGTHHNSDETRERMISIGKLSQRELDNWAKQINEEVAVMVKNRMGVQNPDVQDVSAHANTVAGSPYTQDEVEDLKKAHELKLYRKGKKR